MTYDIAVSGQSCIKYDRNCKLAADSIDFVEVVFHMPSKWAGLECVAQFVQNGKCDNKKKRRSQNPPRKNGWTHLKPPRTT